MSPSGHNHNGTVQIHCQEYLFLGEKHQTESKAYKK